MAENVTEGRPTGVDPRSTSLRNKYLILKEGKLSNTTFKQTAANTYRTKNNYFESDKLAESRKSLLKTDRKSLSGQKKTSSNLKIKIPILDSNTATEPLRSSRNNNIRQSIPFTKSNTVLKKVSPTKLLQKNIKAEDSPRIQLTSQPFSAVTHSKLTYPLSSNSSPRNNFAT